MTVQAIPTRGGISARAAVLADVCVCGLVLLIMMLLGLTMRLAQAQWIDVQPDFFYVVMTMHGAGMVGIAGLSGATVMWYFVRRHVPVSTTVFIANLVFFLIGALFKQYQLRDALAVAVPPSGPAAPNQRTIRGRPP